MNTTEVESGSLNTPTTQEDEEEVNSNEPEMKNSDFRTCVDESYLRSLRHSDEDFVHPYGIIAKTLCPNNGLPCGTPNHKVRVDGKLKFLKKFHT